MRIVTYLFALILCLPASAQIQLSGPPYVPSTGTSTTGQAAVVFTSDANCTVLTATNCTVSGGVAGPWLGGLLVTGTISTPRNLILPTGPNRSYTVINKTTGNQSIQAIAATGSGVVIPNGATFTITWDGTNYVVTGPSSYVASFDTRTGVVTLAATDVNAVGAITNDTSGTAAKAISLNGTANTIPYQDGSGVTHYLANSSGLVQYVAVPASGAPLLSNGAVPTCAGVGCPSQFNIAPSTTPSTLNGAITTTTDPIPIVSGAVYSPSGLGVVGSEVIGWTTNAGNQLGGITRGLYGTTAGSHISGLQLTQIVQSYSPIISTNPFFTIYQNNTIVFGIQGWNEPTSFAGKVVYNATALYNTLMQNAQNSGQMITNFSGTNSNTSTTSSAAISLSTAFFGGNNSTVTVATLCGGPGAFWWRLNGEAGTVDPGACIDKQYNLRVKEMLVPWGTAPAIADGAAAGTSPGTPTITAGSADMAGVLTVTTGTASASSATLATITFSATLNYAPKGCTLFPRNAVSAAASATVYTTAPSTTTWTIAVGTSALTDSTAYSWSYSCF